MTLEILDTLRQFLEVEIFGSSLLFALFIIGFIVVLFLMTKVDLSIVILLSLPLILQLGISGIIPGWISGLLIVAIGIIWGALFFKHYNS